MGARILRGFLYLSTVWSVVFCIYLMICSFTLSCVEVPDHIVVGSLCTALGLCFISLAAVLNRQ